MVLELAARPPCPPFAVWPDTDHPRLELEQESGGLLYFHKFRTVEITQRV